MDLPARLFLDRPARIVFCCLFLIPLTLSIDGTVRKITLMKIFQSKTMPMLVKFDGDSGISSLMIFKRGDDLRQDFVVQTIFFVLNRLWQQSQITDKPFIYQYKYVGVEISVIVTCQDCTYGKENWDFGVRSWLRRIWTISLVGD